MRSVGVFVLLLAVCALPTGCASIVTGTSQIVEVHSTPKGASIQMDGVHVGVTPRLLKVRRGSEHTFMIWKDGFEPQTVIVGREFNMWTLGNILLGVLPAIIDMANGAWMWAVPDTIEVTLSDKKPVKPLPPAEAPKVEEPKPEEKKP